MNAYPTRTLSSRLTTIAAATVATVATTGSVFALIGSATSTPWLPAETVALVAHCDAHQASSERRACVQAAVAGQAVTHVAAR